jgi:hypothetical protein
VHPDLGFLSRIGGSHGQQTQGGAGVVPSAPQSQGHRRGLTPCTPKSLSGLVRASNLPGLNPVNFRAPCDATLPFRCSGSVTAQALGTPAQRLLAAGTGHRRYTQRPPKLSVQPTVTSKPFLLFALLASSCLTAFAASDFERSCQEQLPPSVVTVTTAPSAIRYDFSKSVRDLSHTMSYHKSAPGSNTLGLTVTEMKFASKWAWSTLPGPAGQSCVRASVAVTVSGDPQTIFVAKEFPQGSCAFNEIVKHELRHAQASQSHLERVADYYQKAIGDAFGQTILYGDAGQLKAHVQDALQGKWMPQIKADLAKVSYLHAQIDTPQEYARNNTICNGEIPQRLQQRPAPLR